MPIFLAAIGLSGWESAIRLADGVATVWSDILAETRRYWMAKRRLPTAVLTPLAQTRADFLARPVTTLTELQQRVAMLDAAGFDEVIVAYADRADLDTAVRLLV